MPPHRDRNLQLLDQAPALQAFADRLQPDRNEAGFVVHEALMAAFAQSANGCATADDGRDLRRSVIRRLRLRRPVSAWAYKRRIADTQTK